MTERRNCWTCAYSGPDRDGCDVLGGPSDDAYAVSNWLETAGALYDGTVPEDADGCPGWFPGDIDLLTWET